MMDELILNDKIIANVKKEVIHLVRELVKSDLVEIILYGSCARGDYTDDSDIDIALIVKCDRLESQKYTEGLAEIATELAMKYFAIVNFICLPYGEYITKCKWYEYFRNIREEGQVLYG
ncbi:nucleotidyltransferase domain-containing protein [Ruminococcus sp. 5_1_39BFAA]|uniref:nucleotidyltransferase domain-containing protein n=1 Tax=Ruminococcus sp. 5_1_39BFAA TaxID=457412 RepID=UPI00356B3186